MKVEKRMFLTNNMKAKKRQGLKFIVSYNDTNKLFVFKDVYFKHKKTAVDFYNKLECSCKAVNSL